MVAIVYSDLFLISLIPIMIQAVAGFYVFKLHNILGLKMSLLFGGVNALVFWYDVTVAYLLFVGGLNTQEEQPIEIYGIFIGFIVPTGIAVLLFILQKKLKDALMPIGGLDD